MRGEVNADRAAGSIQVVYKSHGNTIYQAPITNYGERNSLIIPVANGLLISHPNDLLQPPFTSYCDRYSFRIFPRPIEPCRWDAESIGLEL